MLKSHHRRRVDVRGADAYVEAEEVAGDVFQLVKKDACVVSVHEMVRPVSNESRMPDDTFTLIRVSFYVARW